MKAFEIFIREHPGKNNAVKSKEIEALFGLKGTEVRSIVNELRCKGIPVCSCGKGYYYATSDDELRQTIAQLNGRIEKIKNAKNGLKQAISSRNS